MTAFRIFFLLFFLSIMARTKPPAALVFALQIMQILKFVQTRGQHVMFVILTRSHGKYCQLFSGSKFLGFSL